MRNITLNKPVISVVLLPSQKDSQELIRLSQEINKQVESGVELSEHYLPHITLAQIDASESVLEDLWSDVTNFAIGLESIQLTGLAMVPDTHGYLWIEARVEDTERLHYLHLTVVDIAQKHGLRVRSLTGADFRPHCTLGLTNLEQEVSLKLPEYADIIHKEIAVTLAAGVNGENFTFVKAINRL